MPERPARRPSVRRKIAIATWRASAEGRLYARMAVDATPILAYCQELERSSGVKSSPATVVGLAFQRGIEQIPAFHHRVAFGRLVPFTSYDVAFAVDIEGGNDLAPTKVRSADTKPVTDVSRELIAGAHRPPRPAHRALRPTHWLPP